MKPAGCVKKPFPTDLHAKIRAASIERAGGPEMFIYRCPECHAWHLTKSPHFDQLVEKNLKS
jgi:hypothetical protein